MENTNQIDAIRLEPESEDHLIAAFTFDRDDALTRHGPLPKADRIVPQPMPFVQFTAEQGRLDAAIMDEADPLTRAALSLDRRIMAHDQTAGLAFDLAVYADMEERFDQADTLRKLVEAHSHFSATLQDTRAGIDRPTISPKHMQETQAMPLGLLAVAAAANADVISDVAQETVAAVGDIAKAAMPAPEAAPPSMDEMIAARQAEFAAQRQEQEQGLSL